MLNIPPTHSPVHAQAITFHTADLANGPAVAVIVLVCLFISCFAWSCKSLYPFLQDEISTSITSTRHTLLHWFVAGLVKRGCSASLACLYLCWTGFLIELARMPMAVPDDAAVCTTPQTAR